MTMLGDLWQEVNEGLIKPRIDRLKAKALLMAVSIALMALFGILAFVFAIVFVFLGLSNASSPLEAAAILFGFCIFMCLGTFIMFKLASHMDTRRFEADFAASGRLKHPGKPLRINEQMDDMKDRLHDTLSRNKFGGLAAVALTGLLIGSRPGLALRLARFALGRRQRERERYRK